jgi:hypothetical protein
MIRFGLGCLLFALVGCADRLGYVAQDEGGPCDPLYRIASAAPTGCRSAGYVAYDGQVVPKPGTLARSDREANFLNDGLNTATAGSGFPPAATAVSGSSSPETAIRSRLTGR